MQGVPQRVARGTKCNLPCSCPAAVEAWRTPRACLQVDLQADVLHELALGDAQYPGVSQLTSLRLACSAITEAWWSGLPYLTHLQLACARLTRLHLGSCNMLPDSALQGLGDPLPGGAHGCPNLRCAASACPVLGA